jgi:hypothetical protein
MLSHSHSKGDTLEEVEKMVNSETAKQVAVDIVKKRKNSEKIDVASVEQEGGVWVISGTCPIDVEGHPWTEKFEVTVDPKGKVKSTDFSLL